MAIKLGYELARNRWPDIDRRFRRGEIVTNEELASALENDDPQKMTPLIRSHLAQWLREQTGLADKAKEERWQKLFTARMVVFEAANLERKFRQQGSKHPVEDASTEIAKERRTTVAAVQKRYQRARKLLAQDPEGSIHLASAEAWASNAEKPE
jgi:hypothetical protein